MKSAALLALLALLAFATPANAQDLANCMSPSGYSYYPNKGVVAKKNSGWKEDKITGGVVTLKRLNEKEFDILWIDTGKSIRSATLEGGLIRLLRAGETDMTFLVWYPGGAVELYTFLRETDGKYSMHMLTSKGGDAAPIHKSAVLVGSCSEVKFVKTGD